VVRIVSSAREYIGVLYNMSRKTWLKQAGAVHMKGRMERKYQSHNAVSLPFISTENPLLNLSITKVVLINITVNAT
jgi:hypothetical protein